MAVVAVAALASALGAAACLRVLGPVRPAAPAAQLSATGLLLLPNEKEGTLALLDALTLEVAAQVPAGDRPREGLLSPDGRLALVAGDGTPIAPEGTLSVVDLASHNEVKRLTLRGLSRPRGLAWAGSAALFMADCAAPQNPEAGNALQAGAKKTAKKTAARLVAVARYDPGTDGVQPLFTFRLARHQAAALAVSGDARALYILNENGVEVRSLEANGDGAASATPQARISLGGPGRALALSPDASELWIGHDNAITVLDTATHTVKRTVKTGARVVALRFGPDAKQVLVATTRPAQLLIMPAAAHGLTRHVPLRRATPSGIVAVPDARRVFVAADGGGRVLEINLQKALVVGTTTADQQPQLKDER